MKFCVSGFRKKAARALASSARAAGELGGVRCGHHVRPPQERVAKYNRLLEIEAELGKAAVVENPFRQD